MKKVFSILRGARREEGMALLFALGFLAMMLILGLGFVTTALLAQKIAANNSSRAQARMFARSAAARAMLSIMLYNDQASLEGKTIENYDSIYSYDQVKYNKGDDSHSTGTVNDQLCKSSEDSADESKLKYTVGTEDYTGENCKASWLYFYDSPHSTNSSDNAGRKIIGRAAFQVLPRQAGRLSLYAITGGSKVKNDYGAYPHTYRWGRDIAELNLQSTQTLPNWYNSVVATNIPHKYETMYNSYPNFFTSSPDMKKRWLEYWFAEGKNPILKDAFPKLDKNDPKGKKVIYINRFNISDFYYDPTARNNADNDNWYDRFKQSGHRTKGWASVTDENKNSATALEALTDEAVAYKENHSEDAEVNPSGLPFLKRIGNEPWSFENLETLRRQIAANFNDYCDGDSIPTSDVKAAEWSVTDSNKFPTYTGNERTLYINEVALELGVTAKFSSAGGLTYSVQGGADHSKVELSVTPVLLAELVNMYDPDYGDAAAKALLNPASFEFQTALKRLSLDLAVKAVFNIEYSYEVKNSNGNTINSGSGSTTATVDYSDNATAKINYAPGASATTKTVSSFGALNNGYSVGNVALDSLDTSITQPDSGIFSGKINDAVSAKLSELRTANPSGTVTLKVTRIEVQTVGYQPRLANDPKIEFSPFLLKVRSAAVDAATEVKGKGVDFVRMDKAGAMNLIGNPAAQEENPGSDSGSSYKFRRVAYVGGIEARDPRQNLNPNYTDPQRSDWNLAPTVVDYVGAGNGERPVPSMTINTGLTDSEVGTADRVTGGKVNVYAKPSAPQYLNNNGTAVSLLAAEIDKETVTDPAWLNDTATGHVSTAYIRNAPMVSPWEIGLIHRAREWQTLNIKRAGGFGTVAEVQLKDIDSRYDNWTDAGTTYRNGDGAILEFIKVGVNCRCMGKIPLTLLRSEVIEDNKTRWNNISLSYNKDIIKMLFDGVRIGQTMKQFYAETKFDTPSEQGGTAVTTTAAAITNFIEEIDSLYAQTGDKAFRMRSQFINSNYGANEGDSAFTFGMARSDNDALREEFVGKTINLLTVNEETPPNVFRVIVVAQSIKDVGGVGDDSAAIPISKIHRGQNRELKCLIGRFDYVSEQNWTDNTYYDEITGEVKMLVTIERVPAVDDAGNKNKEYGRMVITNIEFID